MIAYEIELRYVIRDKIQSETKSSTRQNSVRDKIQSKTKFSLRKNWEKKFCWKKNLSGTLSQISSVQSKLSWTNRC